MATVMVPYHTSSIPEIRRRLVTELTLRSADEALITDAALVASELVGNAVRHGRPLPDGRIRVSWRLERGHLRIAVTDGGTGPQGAEHPALPGPWAPGGRGLAIVDAVCGQWGVNRAPAATTVWARLEVSAAGAAAPRSAPEPARQSAPREG